MSYETTHFRCCVEKHGVEAWFLPSMMDICTALRRVRGTLLRRGPWVMDGQLLLGTRPALQRQTQTETHTHYCTERQLRVELNQSVASGCCWQHEIYSWCLLENLGKSKKCLIENILISQRSTLYLCISGGSRLILALCSITSFATRPLLWSTETMLRISFTHAHTHGHFVLSHAMKPSLQWIHDDWMVQHWLAGKNIKTNMVCPSTVNSILN